jgi:hypothetical protein
MDAIRRKIDVDQRNTGKNHFYLRSFLDIVENNNESHDRKKKQGKYESLGIMIHKISNRFFDAQSVRMPTRED